MIAQLGGPMSPFVELTDMAFLLMKGDFKTGESQRAFFVCF